MHYFSNKVEKPINRLDGSPSKKLKLGKKNMKLPFFEIELYKVNKERNIGVNNIFLFSLQYGTKVLRAKIQKLLNIEKYDLILVVDIGGDILVNKENLKNVFTPIVDISCLGIIGKVKISAKKYLAVISPGIDGEIKTPQLRKIINKYEKSNILIKTERIQSIKKSQLFIHSLRELKRRINFKSHTPEILKLILCRNLEKKKKYHRTIFLDSNHFNVTYEVLFDKKLINKIFYFDLEKIFRKIPIKADYNNLEEAYLKFKENGVGGTEVDLSYLLDKHKKLFFVANIFYRTNKTQKTKIMDYIDRNISNKFRVIK